VIGVDFRSIDAGKISINRKFFNLSGGVERRVYDWLADQKKTLYQSFLDRHADSVWTALNHVVANTNPPSNAGLHWAFPVTSKGEIHAVWKPVSFPAACFLVEKPSVASGVDFSWMGQETCVVHPIVIERIGDRNFLSLPWNLSSFPPHRATVCRAPKPLIAALWERSTEPQKTNHPAGTFCRFPPGWENLWCAYFAPGYVLLNIENEALRRITDGLWKATERFQWARFDPEEFESIATGNADIYAAWVLRFSLARARTQWEQIRRDVRDRHWEKIAGAKNAKIYIWMQDGSHASVEAVSSYSWQHYEEPAEIERLLPPPPEEWTLHIS
jgi:hypothetical protein